MLRKLGAMAVVIGSMICVQAGTADAAAVRASRTVAVRGPVHSAAAHGHVAVRGVGVGRPGGTVVARGTAVGARGVAHGSARVRY
ncbi:MAG: hypothetical protein SH850_27740 [Planctomycetaceae bacterium]|nr:hypothetical protein [Planctomycetaceae bacterium]